MVNNKAKTLEFPGIGKVQVRKTKGTWQISDPDNLKNYIENSKDFSGSYIENTWKFNKRNLTSY
jgi:hypothetical protein